MSCVTDLHDGERLAGLRQRIDAWLAGFAAGNPLIASVDRGTSDDTSFGEPRWYVRMVGDEKDFTTVWLTLGQRTLRYETYVMPAPEENREAVMEVLDVARRDDGGRPRTCWNADTVAGGVRRRRGARRPPAAASWAGGRGCGSPGVTHATVF